MDATSLSAIPLFAELTPEQRREVAGACEELDFEAGATLVREGDFGYSLFAITSGTAEVVKGGKPIGTLAPGDVFGEIAVLSGGRRAATIVATTSMRVATLMNRDLWRLEHEAPAVGSALRAKIESHVGSARAGADLESA
jgi:cAMP-dependent protein kinase regulator